MNISTFHIHDDQKIITNILHAFWFSLGIKVIYHKSAKVLKEVSCGDDQVVSVAIGQNLHSTRLDFTFGVFKEIMQ